jgi:glutaredoxin-like protein NrdH
MDQSSKNTEKRNHIPGIDRGKVVVYSLSTCIWCKKTKKLLTDLGVDFEYIYVDKLDEEEKNQIIQEVRHFNPSISFPTTIINEKKAILGFEEKEIREAFSF